MKKLLLVLSVFGILAIGTASAQEDGLLRSDLDINLTYSSRFNSNIIIADIIGGFKIGLNGDLQFKLAEMFALGVEAGVHVFSVEINNNPSIIIMDIPVLAKVTLDLGEIEIQAHGGLLMGVDLLTQVKTSTRVMVGAKLYLGNFELLGGYVYNTADPTSIVAERPGYLRVGLGYRIRLAE
jgi:hypothetical protein